MTNLKRFSYYTIQEFCYWEKVRRENRRATVHVSVLCAFLLIIFLSPWIYDLLKVHPVAAFKYGPDHVYPVTLDKWDAALDEAVVAWGKALPEWNIHKPGITIDRTARCNEERVIACVDIPTNTILVSRDEDLWSRKTIMLHEVGHLLGVPHITHDNLMDPSYQGKVDMPTEEAAALARIALTRKWTERAK